MRIFKLTDSADVAIVLDRARARSEEVLQTLRSAAADALGEDPDLIVGVNGSIARREATTGSDVDLFVLALNGDVQAAEGAQTAYCKRLVELNIKMPAHGGVFEKPLPTTELIGTIGGEDDTNTFITRRMLYLLEGEWVANRDGFDSLRSELIARYVPYDLDAHKIVRFLLNDVIRYWRTICVDFEHKTSDATKPRAIRLVKLRLSRMLLYVAGIAAARETVGLDATAKREKLVELLALPPLDRLSQIYGPDRMAPVQALYATFLAALDDEKVRARLELPGTEGLKTHEFGELADVSRDFKVTLLALLDMDAAGDPLMEALLL